MDESECSSDVKELTLTDRCAQLTSRIVMLFFNQCLRICPRKNASITRERWMKVAAEVSERTERVTAHAAETVVRGEGIITVLPCSQTEDTEEAWLCQPPGRPGRC